MKRLRYRHYDHAGLKADARRGRRCLDREIVRRAVDGDEDVPTRTRQAETADRWSHD